MNRPLQLAIGMAFYCLVLNAQTGPNNPVTRSNNASYGTNAWSNPNNINTSNNSRATCATKGLTNYIQGTNFGFSIGSPSAIDGIQLDIERSTNSATAVAVLNNWTTGNTKAISAGVSRCLLAVVAMENGLGARNVLSLTYGGQAMTAIGEASVGTIGGFCGKLEFFRLMEAGITAASNTAFNITYDGTGLQENWESISSAVFQYVDQAIPVSDIKITVSNNANNPITLAPPMVTTNGGVAISAIFCGNNRTPEATIGQSNNYQINSGFTEVIDTYSANTGASTSGGCIQIAHKLTATAATEAPTYTFAGTVNRQVVMTINLQCLRESDNSVRLVQGGVVTGNNLAQTATPWQTTDAYTTYGGPNELWGAVWTTTIVNANNFGAVLSASVTNGTAQIDHMRITIYSHSTLPVELMFFYGENLKKKNRLYWQTATEKNNKHFVVERSDDGLNFKEIGNIEGKGNSRVINFYEFFDNDPLYGNNYYRLKQVDFDGAYEYHRLVVLNSELKNDQLNVFPNPSPDGEFRFISQEPLRNEILIYTHDLKLVKQIPATTESEKISLAELADGTYYMIYDVKGEQKIKMISKSSSTR